MSSLALGVREKGLVGGMFVINFSWSRMGKWISSVSFWNISLSPYLFLSFLCVYVCSNRVDMWFVLCIVVLLWINSVLFFYLVQKVMPIARVRPTISGAPTNPVVVLSHSCAMDQPIVPIVGMKDFFAVHILFAYLLFLYRALRWTYCTCCVEVFYHNLIFAY